jgi:hypothetical protein
LAILKQEENLSGSLFSKYNLNSTSYSGADIKVLVHTYDPISAYKINEDIMIQDRNVNEKNINDLYSRLALLNSKYNITKPGTKENDRINKEMSALNSELVAAKSYQDSLADKFNKRPLAPPIGSVKVLAELQTLSISTQRDKMPVLALGHVYPKGFTRKRRLIAGSMIATVFYKHIFEELMTIHSSEFDGMMYTSAIPDQMPPLDITISFANEYGNVSRMAIYGLEFVSTGMTLSIEDIMTEETMHFVARDFDPIRAVQQRKIDDSYLLRSDWNTTSASSLLFENEYLQEKSNSNPYERYKIRNNPFK